MLLGRPFLIRKKYGSCDDVMRNERKKKKLVTTQDPACTVGLFSFSDLGMRLHAAQDYNAARKKRLIYIPEIFTLIVAQLNRPDV
jgi:hypothetical protein